MRRQIDGNSQANIIGALKIKANHYGGKCHGRLHTRW
jgi:hypothetical protein